MINKSSIYCSSTLFSGILQVVSQDFPEKCRGILMATQSKTTEFSLISLDLAIQRQTILVVVGPNVYRKKNPLDLYKIL